MTNSIKSFCRSRLQIPYYTTCNFSMGYSRKKIKQVGGGWGLGHTFSKTLLEFFIFLLYPWKFQTKQSSTPRNSTKFLLDPLEINSRVKNQDPWPWKFHIIFSVLLHFRSPPIVIDDSHHEKTRLKALR